MEALSEGTGDELKSTLAERGAAIEQRLAEIEAGAVTMTSGIGFGKRIGEGTNIAIERFAEVSRHDRLQTELATLRRAEEKLAEGNYGCCDECGKAIAPERLEALPWAVRCIDCSI